MTQQHLSGLFLLRVVNMLTLFLRRQVQRHVIEIRQAAAPHLSFYRYTAIIDYLSSFTLQIVLSRSLNLRQYLGEEENFARCINLF